MITLFTLNRCKWLIWIDRVNNILRLHFVLWPFSFIHFLEIFFRMPKKSRSSRDGFCHVSLVIYICWIFRTIECTFSDACNSVYGLKLPTANYVTIMDRVKLIRINWNNTYLLWLTQEFFLKYCYLQNHWKHGHVSYGRVLQIDYRYLAIIIDQYVFSILIKKFDNI